MAGAGELDLDELGLDAEALARAEDALAALAGNYLQWAERDLASLREILAAAWPLSPAARGEVGGRLFSVAHDLKGQAATFGYPLLTRLGNAVCRLLETQPLPDDAGLAAVETLVTAMAEVVSLDLHDDGGPAGRDLVHRLADLLPPLADGA